MAGAGRPAAERAGDPDPARGRGDRVAPAGGRGLAEPAGRLAAVADRPRLVPAPAGAGPVRRPAARGGAPPAAQGRAAAGADAGHRRHPGGEGHRRPRPARGGLPSRQPPAGPGGGGRGRGPGRGGGPGGPRGGACPPASRRLDRGDAAEGVLGRERVALVDAEGHWRAVAVVPASVQDRDAPEALDAGKARWPSLREGVYDGAFAAERCGEWSNVHGMRHRVVARDPAARGFVVLARRWVGERSFGWLSRGGGLARDRGGRLDVSAARLALVGVLSGFEALLNPMPARAPAR